jgi:hypothetical protein
MIEEKNLPQNPPPGGEVQAAALAERLIEAFQLTDLRSLLQAVQRQQHRQD